MAIISSTLPPQHGTDFVSAVKQFEDGVLVAGVVVGPGITLGGIVVHTHVPANGDSFFRGKLHMLVDKVDALFTVAEGELLDELIGIVILPDGLIPLVQHTGLSGLTTGVVAVDLAHVVEQCHDGARFRLQSGEILVAKEVELAVDGKRMSDQTTGTGKVVNGGSRGVEKIGTIEPFQERLNAGTADSISYQEEELLTISFDINDRVFGVHRLYLQ